MKESLLEYLICPLCQSQMKTVGIRKYKGDIRSGSLECKGCYQVYPVLLGRPVLMTGDMIDFWKAPIDEVLGLEGSPIPPLSIPRLAEMGVDKALEMFQNVREDSKYHLKSGSDYQASRSVIEKMRYRNSGNWFETGDRRERLLDFGSTELPESFSDFMKTVQDTEPEILLDLASGGGYGVSHQVFNNRKVKQTIAVERDIKCLGNIQYRFKYARADSRAEAIGGDVRILPIRSASIDTVMMLQALHEICGVSKVLNEVHRVLKPGGHFVLEISEEPFTGGLIHMNEFKRFVSKTDLFAGYEKVIEKGDETGLKTELSRSFRREGRSNIRLIRMKKSSAI